MKTESEDGSNVGRCCDLHERLILSECRFFQGTASIEEIQSMNEREQKLFSSPPGKALVCLTLNLHDHRLCAGQHVSVACISTAWRTTPNHGVFFKLYCRVVHFVSIFCVLLYNRWAQAWISALCSIQYDDKIEDVLLKAAADRELETG